MDTINSKLPTIHWTSDSRYDRTRDFIGLAFMDGMSPKHIAAVLNHARHLDVYGRGEDFPWQEDTVMSVIMMMTREREDQLLGLEPDEAPVLCWHGRLTGPLAFGAPPPKPGPKGNVKNAAGIDKLVAGGMTKEKAIIRVNNDREARGRVWTDAYIHHRKTFDLEYALDHIETYPKGGANG